MGNEKDTKRDGGRILIGLSVSLNVYFLGNLTVIIRAVGLSVVGRCQSRHFVAIPSILEEKVLDFFGNLQEKQMSGWVLLEDSNKTNLNWRQE